MMSREWRDLPHDTQATIRGFQSQAPVKVGAVAKALGVKVAASTLQAGISGEIRPDGGAEGGFTIRINRHDADRRQRFTVAHELAHFLLHRDFIRDGIVDDVLYRSNLSDRREAEANRLAADILMPDHLVSTWLDRAQALGVSDLPAYLAERFDVSESAMRIRLGL